MRVPLQGTLQSSCRCLSMSMIASDARTAQMCALKLLLLRTITVEQGLCSKVSIRAFSLKGFHLHHTFPASAVAVCMLDEAVISLICRDRYRGVAAGSNRHMSCQLHPMGQSTCPHLFFACRSSSSNCFLVTKTNSARFFTVGILGMRAAELAWGFSSCSVTNR